MSIVERYKNEAQATTEFWNKYTEILNAKGLNFNLKKEYLYFYTDFVKKFEDKFLLKEYKEKYIEFYQGLVDKYKNLPEVLALLEEIKNDYINFYIKKEVKYETNSLGYEEYKILINENEKVFSDFKKKKNKANAKNFKIHELETGFLKLNQITDELFEFYKKVTKEFKNDATVIKLLKESKNEYVEFYNGFAKKSEANTDIFIQIHTFEEKYKSILSSFNEKAIENTVEPKIVNPIKKDYMSLYNKKSETLFYNSIKVEYDKFCESIAKNKNIFEIETFNAQLREWDAQNRRGESFSLPPTNQLYVVLIAFISKFNAEDTNELLKIAGLEALHGRSPLYCAYVYCLNNNKSYDECIFEIYPKILKLIGEQQNNQNISSINDLKKYVENHKLQDMQMVTNWNVSNTTQIMTDKVVEIQTEEALYKYVLEHKQDLLANRESPRKYLCEALYEHLEIYEPMYKYLNCTFKEFTRIIWEEFNKFYFNILQVSVFDDKDLIELLATMDEDELGDHFSSDTEETPLLKYVQGVKQIDRKVFILLLYFLGEREYLEGICENCDFNPIPTDKMSLYDNILYKLLKFTPWDIENNPDKFRSVLIENYSEIRLVKIYCDLTYFKEKLTKYFAKKPSPDKDLYCEIIDTLKQKLFAIKSISKNNCVIIDNVLFTFNYLHKIYEFEACETTNNYLNTIKKLVEESFNKRPLTKSFKVFCIISITLNAKSSKKNRENYLLTKYLQNPLSLNPKSDL